MKTCKTPVTRWTADAFPHPQRGRNSALALVALLGIVACDSIPTAPPRFETRLLIPGETTTLSVNSLLPQNVEVQGTSFRLTVPSAEVPGKTLAQMCPDCAGAPPNVPVPKPAFTDSVTSAINLPDSVNAATITSGSVLLSLTHNFGFDVVRPAGATGGSLTVTIRSGTNIVGSTSHTGTFPSGVPLMLNVPLSGEVTGPLQATVRVVSPAAVVAMNSTGTFSGTATPGSILVSSARIAIANRTVSADPVSIDLTEVDEVLRNHVVRGAFVVTMTNPFAVTGTLTLRITGANVAPKQLQIVNGTSTQRIDFSQAELQSMLGNNITITISGPISATGGSLVVQPGQAVSVSTNLDLVFEVGT